MMCHYCLYDGDDGNGEARPYDSEESGLVSGNYHPDCAEAVGFNEWDAK